MNNVWSLRTTARVTGLLYFISAMTAIFVYAYVSPKIYEEGNISATAGKMLANEFLFRVTLLINIVANILFVLVILLLYRLLRKINEGAAAVMAATILVVIPISFISDGLRIAALYIFKGDLLKSYSIDQSHEIAALLLKVGDYIAKLISFHWGFWLIPLGWLIYKSGFIPRILGILLLVNGLGFIISSTTYILFPEYFDQVLRIIFPTFLLGEIPLMIWLMIKGTKNSYKHST